MIESQIRKLQVENSSLQTENKLLKEKNNRAQSKLTIFCFTSICVHFGNDVCQIYLLYILHQGRISHLEMQLAQVQRDADTIHEEISEEMSALKRRNRDRADREKQELHDQNIKLNKQLSMLRVEVSP